MRRRRDRHLGWLCSSATIMCVFENERRGSCADRGWDGVRKLELGDTSLGSGGKRNLLVWAKSKGKAGSPGHQLAARKPCYGFRTRQVRERERQQSWACWSRCWMDQTQHPDPTKSPNLPALLGPRDPRSSPILSSSLTPPPLAPRN